LLKAFKPENQLQQSIDRLQENRAVFHLIAFIAVQNHIIFLVDRAWHLKEDL